MLVMGLYPSLLFAFCSIFMLVLCYREYLLFFKEYKHIVDKNVTPVPIMATSTYEVMAMNISEGHRDKKKRRIGFSFEIVYKVTTAAGTQTVYTSKPVTLYVTNDNKFQLFHEKWVFAPRFTKTLMEVLAWQTMEHDFVDIAQDPKNLEKLNDLFFN